MSSSCKERYQKHIELGQLKPESPSILVFDPGESTGWCFLGRDDRFVAGTLPKDHMKVAEKIDLLFPDIVVYESFNLYPSMAKSLAWNSFYPCEVIGVILYKATSKGCIIEKQAPSVKKFAGNLPKKFFDLDKKTYGITEHSKDATQHLCYYLRQVGAIGRVLS